MPKQTRDDSTCPENKALLCLETSTSVGSVALVRPGGMLARCCRNSRTPHTGDLFLKVRQLLDDFALQPADLLGVAVAAGPGSFTGLRVAVSAAKTLAWTAGVPLYAVCSLEALACGAASRGLPVCALFNAGREELYAAVYSWPEPGGPARRVIDPAPFTFEKLCTRLRGIERLVCLGEGFRARESELAACLGAGLVRVPPRYDLPDAALVGELVFSAPEKFRVQDIFRFEPFYLRSDRAQLRLKE
ncbi:MAG: tRNA (adenosine(37)-N6)-threonylcarbamoyltransferase complex dimerization subunit type 1 TsaB [Candidatus Glassbacteria bacterium]|nr:tRNA (adenosine(37)-N6)-threonylcarbamoyltransferase complex dimerization subunit type 1 TsaB [Candidatus Glassbacteria bacterium]